MFKQISRHAERGYALASILLLITILSVVAASVVGLIFLRKQLALVDVAKVQADHAAENVITRVLVASRGALSQGRSDAGESTTYSFADGSTSRVHVEPWGLHTLMHSEGIHGRMRATRTALAAQKSVGIFSDAIIFGNPNHQLVFAGTAAISGDVLVGSPGVTTGSLRNLRTPPRIPVSGNIKRERAPQLPVFRLPELVDQIRTFKNPGAIASAARVVQLDSRGDLRLKLSSVSDSIEAIIIRGDVDLEGAIIRREKPLRISASGSLRFAAAASLRGLVSVYTPKGLIVASGTTLEHTILVSEDSIRIERGVRVVGQFFAPRITLDSGSVAAYSSILVSVGVGPRDTTQRIQIKNGSRVEGCAVLFSTTTNSHLERILIVEPRARVVGLTYSDSKTTLDGTVFGTVMTNDFYFYESPTQYYGWIRNATIDRTKMPREFLFPVGFSGNSKLQVLDWL